MKLNRIPKPILISSLFIIALVALWHFGAEWCFSAEASAPAGESPPEKIPKRIIGKDGTPMVLIPAGEFQMGSDDGEDNEKPVHTVYVDAFYMDIYEVTNAQFQKFFEAKGVERIHWSLRRPGFSLPNSPVIGEGSSAMAYCEWAGKRLPTEAEWEKAARGGLEGKKYPWGDEPPDETKTNFNNYVGHPTPVGSYPPNGYGLYDMMGNVREWVADWYRPDYYQNSPKRNPKGPDSGLHGWHVARGGDWHYVPEHLRVSTRRGDYRASVRYGGYHFGFRCAKSVSQ